MSAYNWDYNLLSGMNHQVGHRPTLKSMKFKGSSSSSDSMDALEAFPDGVSPDLPILPMTKLGAGDWLPIIGYPSLVTPMVQI